MTSIVTKEWLNNHLNDEHLVILDASLPKPATKYGDYPLFGLQIPNARFFDIKRMFSDTSTALPNTLPSPEAFENAAQELGINQGDTIVVYDFIGIHSSPRAWWLFKSMGHENVFVLDGGLPAWYSKDFAVEQSSISNYAKGNFKANYNPNLFCSADYVENQLFNNNTIVLDARSKGRFEGNIPEPREGVRLGHIPNAKSLPSSQLLKENQLKSKETLSELFEAFGTKDKELVFSCGSGITACILALGATEAAYVNLKVYDGSWTEWGSDYNRPIETEKHA